MLTFIQLDSFYKAVFLSKILTAVKALFLFITFNRPQR